VYSAKHKTQTASLMASLHSTIFVTYPIVWSKYTAVLKGHATYHISERKSFL